MTNPATPTTSTDHGVVESVITASHIAGLVNESWQNKKSINKIYDGYLAAEIEELLKGQGWSIAEPNYQFGSKVRSRWLQSPDKSMKCCLGEANFLGSFTSIETYKVTL